MNRGATFHLSIQSTSFSRPIFLRSSCHALTNFTRWLLSVIIKSFHLPSQVQEVAAFRISSWTGCGISLSRNDIAPLSKNRSSLSVALLEKRVLGVSTQHPYGGLPQNQ